MLRELDFQLSNEDSNKLNIVIGKCLAQYFIPNLYIFFIKSFIPLKRNC